MPFFKNRLAEHGAVGAEERIEPSAEAISVNVEDDFMFPDVTKGSLDVNLEVCFDFFAGCELLACLHTSALGKNR